MKDYGNISSSGDNSVDEMIDNLYNFKYDVDIALPLDIIEKKSQTDKQTAVDKELDDIDLSILTKVLIPPNVLNEKENDKVWTFESILNDLQSAIQTK